MSYNDQLAFLSTNLLFNQAVLSATAAFNQNPMGSSSMDKIALEEVKRAIGAADAKGSELASISEMFQLPTVPDLFRILPSAQTKQAIASPINPSNWPVNEEDEGMLSESELAPYLGKSRRRRHPRRKIPPPVASGDGHKADGAIIRHCTNCGVIGHDRRNCQKPRFDKSGATCDSFL
jgi:hypothetical protein